jgi:hypothetical protein
VSDELIVYKTVIREKYSTEVPVEPTEKRGWPRNPEKTLNPELDYATVHKTRENGKVTKIQINQGRHVLRLCVPALSSKTVLLTAFLNGPLLNQ